MSLTKSIVRLVLVQSVKNVNGQPDVVKVMIVARPQDLDKMAIIVVEYITWQRARVLGRESTLEELLQIMNEVNKKERRKLCDLQSRPTVPLIQKRWREI